MKKNQFIIKYSPKYNQIGWKLFLEVLYELQLFLYFLFSMNRLSLIAGTLPLSARQNVKQAAFLEYLKSFASNGLQTLEKLESQFNKHRTSPNQPNHMKTFKTFENIKTLIASYQLFVLEMNDSCEFIEAPEFGTCLLKVFIQLIAILKWALQQVLVEKQLNTEALQTASSSASDALPVKQAVGSSFYSINSARSRREQKTIRNTFNGKISLDVPKDGACPECLKKISPNMYQIKQQANLQLKDINEEIIRISKEYADEQHNARKQDAERSQLQKFIQKRDDACKLLFENGLGESSSRNEQILAEILYNLTRKGEAIKKFADLRMSSIVDLGKIQSTSQEGYETLKNEISADLNQRMVSAKHRLGQLFKDHIIQHDKLKKEQLIDTGVQIDEGDSIKMHKFNHEKVIKKLKAQIKRLQKELQCEKSLNQLMQKILASKSIEYEAQVSKYRNELLILQMKSKKEAVNSSRFDESLIEKRPQKSSFYLSRNSSFLIKFEKQEENMGNINENMDESVCSSESKNAAMNGFMKNGKLIPKLKSPFKFQKISDNSNSPELQFISSLVNQKILPSLKAQSLSQVQIVQNQYDVRKQERRIVTNSVAIQTTGHRLQKSETIHEETNLMKSQYKARAINASRTPKKSPHMYRKVNLTATYIKKPSLHQNQEGAAIHTAGNRQVNKEKKNEDLSLLSCSMLHSKSSKFLQRTINFNTVPNSECRNEFTSLNLTEVQINKDYYKKKHMSGVEQNSKIKYAIMDKKPCTYIDNAQSIQEKPFIRIDKAQSIQENPSHKIRFHSLVGNKIEDKENIVAQNQLN